MFVDALMIFALIAQAISLNLRVLYVTRFIFGFFCGISSALVPPYLTSIAPLSMTGLIGSFNQLMFALGIAVAYAFNFLLYSDVLQPKYKIPVIIIAPLPLALFRTLILGTVFP